MDNPIDQQVRDLLRIHPELMPFADACNGKIQPAEFATEIDRQLDIHLKETILSRKGIQYGQAAQVMDPVYRFVVQADILVERGLFDFGLAICCSIVDRLAFFVAEPYLDDEPQLLVDDIAETIRSIGWKSFAPEKIRLFNRIQPLILKIPHDSIFYNTLIGMTANLIGNQAQEDWIVREFDRAYDCGMTESDLVDIVIPMVKWLRNNARHEEADDWVDTYKNAWMIRELKIRELMEDQQWEIAAEECDQGIAEGSASHNPSAVMRMIELKREISNKPKLEMLSGNGT
jgi:hypothetical protein